jgi:site-specific DNA recombinase
LHFTGGEKMNRKYPSVLHDNTAVIYARYSSHNQRDESIEAQIRACESYAKNKRLHIVSTYIDQAKTGTNAERENFQRMIRDSGKGFFRYLIIHKLDRFSRDKFDAVTFKRKLKTNGVIILSVTENLDNSPESVMLESCLEGMAQYFSLNLSREVMKGMKESAYQCTHLGGIPPLGYDVDPLTKKYVLNEEEADIVRTIFEKYASGTGYNQILDYLNGNGFKSKRGRTFGKNSLHDLLRNEKYMGKFIFNKKLEKDVSGKRNPQVKPENEWIIVDGGLPAIIDEEIFNKVQIKMSSNKKKAGCFKAKEVYLLSGLLKCGECGASMYGNSHYDGRHKSRYSAYICSNNANHKGCNNIRIRKEQIENYVLDELESRLFSDSAIRQLSTNLLEYAQRQNFESDRELAFVQEELGTVIHKINRIVRFVTESDLSIETVRKEMKQLELMKHSLETQILEMTITSTASIISESMIADHISKFREAVENRDIRESRQFIHSFVEKVISHRDRVEIFFRLHASNGSDDSLSQLRSEESRATLRKEYRQTG